jgi:MYXO-CTERM domain-containing protein
VRLRGYLNIPNDLVQKPVHFGMFLDDGASITIFDKTGAQSPVIVRAPMIGLPTWRVTSTVTFNEPGLYPFEVLYAEIAEHAALEVSYFVGDFTDFELPANSPGSVSLKSSGYALLPSSFFYQSESGSPLTDPTMCAQCDRKFAGKPGEGGCEDGTLCNSAGLCGPCDTVQACGPMCAPCGDDAPLCIPTGGSFMCVQCITSSDCSDGAPCENNQCVVEGSGGAGGGGGEGGGATSASSGAGTGGGAMDGGVEGCSCRTRGGTSEGGLAALVAAGAFAWLRRRPARGAAAGISKRHSRIAAPPSTP